MPCEFSNGLSDSCLLAMYSREGHEPAFEELVQRYRPMVLRVCRQILPGGAEADDAAQQVFIALTSQAAVLQDRDSIASWLYRVAWNISTKTRRAAGIRRGHEISVASQLPGQPRASRTEPDTLLILQEALAEIPDACREAIVLRYFCGYTTAETAARLRCPAGTVAARVSRGLERLRLRLSDRGLILSAVAINLALLGIMGGVKTAAAAVLKGGLPRPASGFKPFPRPRILRLARALGLLPAAALFPGIARASGAMGVRSASITGAGAWICT